jgi:predicted metal-dependent enzyme (double-stranded beta helix superfamily)
MQQHSIILSRRDLLIGAGASAVLAATSPIVRAQTARPRATSRFEVERFVDDCKHANMDAQNPQLAVQEVLARAISNPGTVLSGVGAPAKGGIQTLYRSDNLTILNIVWAPLMQLMPHEHNMWALIGIYTGREDNIFWQRQGGLLATSAKAISPGYVVPLPKDIIHSVANPIEKLTGAIHIYGGDFFAVPRSEWDPESLAERDWNIQGAIKLFEQSNDRFYKWRERNSCG